MSDGGRANKTHVQCSSLHSLWFGVSMVFQMMNRCCIWFQNSHYNSYRVTDVVKLSLAVGGCLTHVATNTEEIIP